MRRAARTDQNHEQVRLAFRKCGCVVYDTSAVGQGFPDLIVVAKSFMAMVEVKDGAKSPSRRKLTEDQVDFHAKCPRTIYIVTDPADVPGVILAASREGA